MTEFTKSVADKIKGLRIPALSAGSFLMKSGLSFALWAGLYKSFSSEVDGIYEAISSAPGYLKENAPSIYDKLPNFTGAAEEVKPEQVDESMLNSKSAIAALAVLSVGALSFMGYRKWQQSKDDNAENSQRLSMQ